MKNRASKCALIALFLILLYVPTIVGVVAGDSVKSANLENRRLNALPEFSLKNIGDLPRGYEAYYADNQPFRDQLITFRALMSRALYDRDISNQVVFGKDDWLFYCNKADGAPIDSYRGEDLLSRQELRQIATSLMQTRDNLRKRGCDFVLFIAPNKERVYSEYMPDRFGPPAERYGVGQLVDFLRRSTDLKVVYPYEELMQAKQAFEDIPIYYSKDTHWNHVGGYIGARALMRALGVELPELRRDRIQPTGQNGPCDLPNLSHLTPVYTPDMTYTVTVPPEEIRAEETKDKVLYFRHDSFGDYMDDYLLPCFSQSGTTLSTKRDDTQVDEARPDVYVMEVVERNLRGRKWYKPLYILPEDR